MENETRHWEKIVKEIENQMERWHLARDNDDETLQSINDILYKEGFLTFFNDKKFHKPPVRPEIIGWEVTTNENGVKMATLPRDTMEQIVKYIEYADKQLRLGAVSGRSEQLKTKNYGNNR